MSAIASVKTEPLPQCCRCKHFDGRRWLGKPGSCRLNPPKVMLTGFFREPKTYAPQVDPTDWCGHFIFTETPR